MHTFSECERERESVEVGEERGVCVSARGRGGGGWHIEYETVAGPGAITRQRLAAAVAMHEWVCLSVL